MPLSTQTPILARGFDILFDKNLAPTTTEDSARVWANAYTSYAVSAGIPLAKAKESIFASSLTVAFNPNLAGGGPILFIQALTVFWLGLPIPYMVGIGPGVVSAVIPTGSINSPQPDDATPLQQADGLAQVIAGFTLGSVKVIVPPATAPIPIV